MNIEKVKVKVASYNQVFRQNFQFVNLASLRWNVWGASYNRVHLITEKLVTWENQ